MSDNTIKNPAMPDDIHSEPGQRDPSMQPGNSAIGMEGYFEGDGRDDKGAPITPQGGFLSFESGPDTKTRLATIIAAANPLLEAAQPLMRALAEMPTQLGSEAEIEGLRDLLVREVYTFQTLCDQANLRRDHVQAVRYCLCTALDEAANKTTWGGGGVWAQKSLLIRFHNESYGGEKVFLLVGRLSPNPQEHGNVLEVIYRILGLGFEGRYSVRTDGQKQLASIRQQLFSIITSQRDSVAQALSLHWKGESGRLRLLRGIPVWVTASVFALILFAIFAWYKYQLLNSVDDLQQRIAALSKMEIPVKSPQKLRLKILLKDEIARGVVNVDEDERQSKVTFLGDFMFVPGQKTVNEKMMPLLSKVAAEINKVQGKVTVTGHTDNTPIKTRIFPSNQVLSEKRAHEVAQLLIANGVDASRLEIVGKGDTEPAADNASLEGRAKNRRVDIVVVE